MSKTWTKNDLIEKIQSEIGISLSDSSKIFEEIIEEILLSLEMVMMLKFQTLVHFRLKRKIQGLVETLKLEMKKRSQQEMLFHFIHQKQ